MWSTLYYDGDASRRNLETKTGKEVNAENLQLEVKLENRVNI